MSKKKASDNIVRIHNQNTQRRRRRRVLFWASCCAVLVLSGIAAIRQYENIKAQKAEIARLEEQIQQTQEYNEELAVQKEYMQTDEYIESVARDYLGLLKDEEIRFVEDD